MGRIVDQELTKGTLRASSLSFFSRKQKCKQTARALDVKPHRLRFFPVGIKRQQAIITKQFPFALSITRNAPQKKSEAHDMTILFLYMH